VNPTPEHVVAHPQSALVKLFYALRHLERLSMLESAVSVCQWQQSVSTRQWQEEVMG
jgi:hypothetical protein